MSDFKPAGRIISKSEKEFLLLNNSKWCSKCCQVLKLELFSINQNYCKQCINKLSSDWSKRNRERKNQKRNEWRKNNKEKYLEQCREYRSKNLEKMREKERELYAKRQPQIRERKNLWYELNKDKVNQRKRKWRQGKKSDPMFNLAKRLRDRIYSSFKRGKFRKTKTLDILGCDWDTARQHLESKFLDGMNWENMGLWHIDHIKPLSSASNEEELRALCHYTNLQPLWAQDNLRKSSKLF